MNRKMVLGLTVMVMTLALLSCAKANPENDFEVKKLNGGVVEISGYVGETKDVVIPSKIGGSPVTSIGANAFANKELTSVVIPNSVMFIESEAFANNQLTKVAIGNKVLTIASGAFAYNQLTRVTIPNKVTNISMVAFTNNQLTKVTIGKGVKGIGPWAFTENQLTSVTVPKSANIDIYAFDEGVTVTKR